MSAVSIREFSYNPSAMFARVERGETIEVTRHGTVIAVLIPGAKNLARYSELVSKGVLKLKASTTNDLPAHPPFPVEGDVSPLDVLLAEREADPR